jgi:ribonuclease T2
LLPGALIAVLFVAIGAAHARADDAYVLALTWQPAFCASHATLAECRTAAKPRLVLHGLWPDWDVDGDGRRSGGDAFCTGADRDRASLVALDAAATRSGDWKPLPDVQLSAATTGDLAGVMPGVAAGLERHEWWKHGTCSGLKAEDYFATAILLVREVERGQLARLIVEHAGGSVERAALLDAFAADFGKDATRALTLDCAKTGDGTSLAEIRIRLQRTKVTEGLDPESLDVPDKPAKGDCAATILIPGIAP